jgi:hypothetical protein
MIEEEIHAKLLEEVRKGVDNILIETEDVKIRNRKLRNKNKILKGEIKEFANQNRDKIENREFTPETRERQTTIRDCQLTKASGDWPPQHQS